MPLTHILNYKGDKSVKKQLLRFTLFLLICLSIPLMATAQMVDIPDANLRAAIETTLGKGVRRHNHHGGYGNFDAP